MSNDNISQVRDALLAKPEEKAPKHLVDDRPNGATDVRLNGAT